MLCAMASYAIYDAMLYYHMFYSIISYAMVDAMLCHAMQCTILFYATICYAMLVMHKQLSLMIGSCS